MASNVQTAINALLVRLGANNITVKVTGASSPVTGSTVQEVILSILFQGAGLAGLSLPQLVALASGDATVVESEVADNAYGTEVATGAALQLDLGGGGSVNETVQLNGTGPTGAGALENLSGNNYLTGTVNLQTSSAIGVDTNPTLGSALTISGDVTGTWGAALSKVGGGTLGLAAANQYQGTTYVAQGILSAQNDLALGGPLTDEVQTITLTGALTGSYQLTFTDGAASATTGSISASASAQQLQSALATLFEGAPFNLSSAVANQSVLVSLNPVGTVYTVTLTGAFAGVNLGYPGPLTLASASSGTGVGIATLVEGGQGNTIVAPGATLQLANNGSGDVQISTEQVILSGTGVNGQGALESAFGSNSWDPNTQPLSASDPTIPDSSIILSGNAAIGVDFGGFLTIDQTVARIGRVEPSDQGRPGRPAVQRHDQQYVHRPDHGRRRRGGIGQDRRRQRHRHPGQRADRRRRRQSGLGRAAARTGAQRSDRRHPAPQQRRADHPHRRDLRPQRPEPNRRLPEHDRRQRQLDQPGQQLHGRRRRDGRRRRQRQRRDDRERPVQQRHVHGKRPAPFRLSSTRRRVAPTRSISTSRCRSPPASSPN